jgi:hypothetical protein
MQGTASFTINVNEVNTPPVLNPPSNMTVLEGNVGTQQLTATDADVPAQALYFFKGTGPSFLSVTVDGLVSVSPPTGTAGVYPASVLVSDVTSFTELGFQITVTGTHMNATPVVTITGPPSGSVYPVGTAVTLAGTFTDDAGDTHTAQWALDATAITGTVNEGAHTVSGSYTFTQAGVYMIALTVTDNHGASGTASTIGSIDELVVVYDPSAGFVTGGGWIDSPPGAYAASPSLVGKANFGFVSKYKKGQSTPTGETEFQFKMAGLSFHSDVYEWLVVSGAKAQYKAPEPSTDPEASASC